MAETPPTFQAAGTFQGTTLAATVPWPTHQVDDVALLVIESNNATLAFTDAAGFVEVTNSPQTTSSLATRLHVYWCRATSSAMTSPVLTAGYDHVAAQILTFRGVIGTGNPWDVSVGSAKNTASTAASIPGPTTTATNTYVVAMASRAGDFAGAFYSGEANADLTGFAELSDQGTGSGNGGGFVVYGGSRAVTGAVGATTATLNVSGTEAYLALALKPALVFVSMSGSTGGSFSLSGAMGVLVGMSGSTGGAFSLSGYMGRLVGLSGSTGGAFSLSGAMNVALGNHPAHATSTAALAFKASSSAAVL